MTRILFLRLNKRIYTYQTRISTHVQINVAVIGHEFSSDIVPGLFVQLESKVEISGLLFWLYLIRCFWHRIDDRVYATRHRDVFPLTQQERKTPITDRRRTPVPCLGGRPILRRQT